MSLNKGITSKSGLAIALSKLKGFEKPIISMEQYETDSETAATIIWNMLMLGDIEGKTIADLGAGTGVLGTGCALLGASKVLLVESEDNAIELAKINLKTLKIANAEIRKTDINDFNEKIDVVIQNPPFGTRKEHADKIFLEKAIKISPVIYSLHKSSTAGFVRAFAQDNGFMITHEWDCKPILRRTQVQHRREIHRIECTWFRMTKIHK